MRGAVAVSAYHGRGQTVDTATEEACPNQDGGI